MDTRTVGMAVSASAFGATLAYLGFTNYTDTKDTETGNETDTGENNTINSSILPNEPLDVTEKFDDVVNTGNVEETNNKEFESEAELKQDEDKIKGEVKNVIEKEAWGKFWKQEYENVDKNGSIKPGINAEGF
jgi:midasin (ATPase involved in ribosome maturation)